MPAAGKSKLKGADDISPWLSPGSAHRRRAEGHNPVVLLRPTPASLRNVDDRVTIIAVDPSSAATRIIRDRWQDTLALRDDPIRHRRRIVLADSQAGRSVLDSQPAYSAQARLATYFRRCLMRAPAAFMFRGRVLVGFGVHRNSIIRFIQDYCGSLANVSVSSPTTANPGRTIIWASGGRDGPALVVKVADEASINRWVDREATVLAHLPPGVADSGAVPRLVDVGDLGEHRYMIATQVAGRSASVGWDRPRSMFIDRLNSDRYINPRDCELVDYVATIVAGMPVAFRIALGGVLASMAGVELQSTVVHGDFAPWNILDDNGTIGVIDWEFASLDGLPLLDRVYHDVAIFVLLKKYKGAALREAFLRLRRELADEHGPIAHVLATFELIRLAAVRYDRGTAMADPMAWVAEHLVADRQH